jgi:hypothetical protein
VACVEYYHVEGVLYLGMWVFFVSICISFFGWGGGRLLQISSIYLVLMLHAELIFGGLSEKLGICIALI